MIFADTGTHYEAVYSQTSPRKPSMRQPMTEGPRSKSPKPMHITANQGPARRAINPMTAAITAQQVHIAQPPQLPRYHPAPGLPLQTIPQPWHPPFPPAQDIMLMPPRPPGILKGPTLGAKAADPVWSKAITDFYDTCMKTVGENAEAQQICWDEAQRGHRAEQPWYKNWKIWAGVGVGVVVLGGGIYLATR